MAPEPEPSLPRSAPPNFSDHNFKTSDGAELAVRVWPADPPVEKSAPVVIYTHGGGWMAGNHYAPLAWMDPGFRQRGYHLVSHNYRLGPQANLGMQLEDCLAAVAWCRAELPKVLGADKVDVDRYVVCGESAGGHLTTLMAHHLSPPPRAVIDVYGIVDLETAWPIMENVSNNPDAPAWAGEFSDAELEAFLVDRDPANILTDACFWDETTAVSEELLSKLWATDMKYTRRLRLQAELHQWRSDLSARMASGVRSILKGTLHDENFSNIEAVKSYTRTMSPLALLETKKTYPPTAFLHGMADEAAPLAQSQAMAKKLSEMGVPVVECYEPGMGHVFDKKYKNADVAGWDTYIQPILDFCKEHVK